MGRAGFGAVLGWKKLKAITVSGNKTIPLFDPLKTMEEIKKLEPAYSAESPYFGPGENKQLSWLPDSV